MSLDEIAAAAGVRKPAIYEHFGDKAGLAEALAASATEEVSTKVTRRLLADPAMPAEDALRIGIDAFTRFLTAEKPLYQFIVRSVKVRDAEILDSALVPMFEIYADMFLTARFPTMPPPVRRIAAYAFIGQVFTACEAWLRDGGMSRRALVDTLVSLFVGGARDLAP